MMNDWDGAVIFLLAMAVAIVAGMKLYGGI